MTRLLLAGIVLPLILLAQNPPIRLNNGWISGTVTPITCSSGNSPDFYNVTNKQLYICLGNLYIGGANVGITTGFNIFVGPSALPIITTGVANVAIGFGAMQRATTANSNVSVGQGTLNFATTGSNNTAVGTGALINLTTGATNVGIGVGAGTALTTANNNSFLGNGTAAGAQNDYMTVIGAGATGACGNCIVLGRVFDVVSLPPTTVANLPPNSNNTCTAAFAGFFKTVSDANAPVIGSTVVGGAGANAAVWCNGTNWTVIGK